MNIAQLIHAGVDAQKDKVEREMLFSEIGLTNELCCQISHIQTIGRCVESLSLDKLESLPDDFLQNIGYLIEHHSNICEVLRDNLAHEYNHNREKQEKEKS